MSRFAHLELDSSGLPTPAPQQPLREAGYFERLAHERMKVGRSDEALRLFSRAIEHERGRISAWIGQLEALIELDEPSEAQIWADKALEVFPEHAELLAMRAIALARRHRSSAALACADAALAQPGSSARRWRARAEALLASDPTRAEYCFAKAMAEAGGTPQELIAAGRACLYHGHPTFALPQFTRAVELSPSDAWAWANLGLTRERLKQRPAAQAAYHCALELDPSQVLARQRTAPARWAPWRWLWLWSR
jgi:tetratricopeptide (TPR) repeat protein